MRSPNIRVLEVPVLFCPQAFNVPGPAVDKLSKRRGAAVWQYNNDFGKAIAAHRLVHLISLGSTQYSWLAFPH